MRTGATRSDWALLVAPILLLVVGLIGRLSLGESDFGVVYTAFGSIVGSAIAIVIRVRKRRTNSLSG